MTELLDSRVVAGACRSPPGQLLAEGAALISDAPAGSIPAWSTTLGGVS